MSVLSFWVNDCTIYHVIRLRLVLYHYVSRSEINIDILQFCLLFVFFNVRYQHYRLYADYDCVKNNYIDITIDLIIHAHVFYTIPEKDGKRF